MLDKLPIEIQVELLLLNPNSSLKLVNSHFYMLYNDLYYNKIIDTFGDDIITVIKKVLPWLKTYIKTLDVFRYHNRNIICSRLKLPYVDDTIHDVDGDLNVAYIKDSWKYIYAVLKSKRLFAEYSDYKIDEPTNYIFHHFVEINRTYLLSYNKTLWLSPGTYNLNVGLVIKHGNGLGTTKFEIKYENDNNEIITQTFYPPTNINDILPKKQFCLLRLGEFTIPEPSPQLKSNLLARSRSMHMHANIPNDSNHDDGEANINHDDDDEGEGEGEEFDDLINIPRNNPNLSNLAQRIRTSNNDFNFNPNFTGNFTNNNPHHYTNLSNMRNSNNNLNGVMNNAFGNNISHSRGNSIGNLIDNNPSRSNSLPTIISTSSLASLNTNNTVFSASPIQRVDSNINNTQNNINHQGNTSQNSTSNDNQESDQDDDTDISNNYHPKLVKVELIMEEIGLYLKSGFRIYFIDVAHPTTLFNEYDLLYYSVRETDYRYFINIPLKNFYRALNFIQNGGKINNTSVEVGGKKYGEGDPYEILDEYDSNFVTDPLLNEINKTENNSNETNEQVHETNDHNECNEQQLLKSKSINEKQLMKYSDFYYNKSFIRRYFKFHTIYQRRQFINKFGDFEIDWKKGENKNFNSTNSTDSYSHSDLKNLIVGPDENRACVYDLYGLKWKMPPLGQL